MAKFELVELKGPSGKIKVRKENVDAYLARGFERTNGEEEAAPAEDSSSEPTEDGGGLRRR